VRSRQRACDPRRHGPEEVACAYSSSRTTPCWQPRSRALTQAAYVVDLAEDGETANEALRGNEYDLVVLDIALPKLDGLAVLKRMRDRRSHVPVLILTARDTLEDRVTGLDLGADDYMTKPFDLPEFEARVRALIRRGLYNAGSSMTHGRLRFDTVARRLFYDDQPVEMSARSCRSPSSCSRARARW
jgi:two-component system OmpR family response regulator